MKDDGKLLALATTSTPRQSDEEETKRRGRERQQRHRERSGAEGKERARLYAAEYRQKNAEHFASTEFREENAKKSRAYSKANSVNLKSSRLVRDYGITLEEREELLLKQGGVCAICSADNPRRIKADWAVDHCHDTGSVRGILCHPCNLMLGHAHDNPAALVAAITYLSH